MFVLILQVSGLAVKQDAAKHGLIVLASLMKSDVSRNFMAAFGDGDGSEPEGDKNNATNAFKKNAFPAEPRIVRSHKTGLKTLFEAVFGDNFSPSDKYASSAMNLCLILAGVYIYTINLGGTVALPIFLSLCGYISLLSVQN